MLNLFIVRIFYFINQNNKFKIIMYAHGTNKFNTLVVRIQKFPVCKGVQAHTIHTHARGLCTKLQACFLAENLQGFQSS